VSPTALAPGTLAPAVVVAERVRERLRAERTDPARNLELATQIVRAEVRRHNDFALARGLSVVDDEPACVREVLAAVAGFGPLQPYLEDPTIEEVWLNAPDRPSRGSADSRSPSADAADGVHREHHGSAGGWDVLMAGQLPQHQPGTAGHRAHLPRSIGADDRERGVGQQRPVT